MSKFFDKYFLVLKSIGKFWTLTFFFIVLLLTLQGIIPEIYSTVSKALKWDTINYIPFLLVCLLFTGLISQIFKSIVKKKLVEWKPLDAFIMACCLYSSYSLEFVEIDPFNLLFSFVSLASLYFLIKASFWFNGLRITKNTKTDGTNQLDQDQSLENTKDFENIKDLNKLKELDKLGRFDHAQQISHVINNIKPEKSFAIGINGEWGSGKTSFIHLVRKINQIEHPNQCKFIIFNPWYFTGTEKVLIKFHEALLTEAGSFSLSFRNELHRYFQLICNMENNLWETNFLQYFQKQTDFQSQLEKLKGYFKKLPQKIVIIIDDMDRLQKDEVLVLFRTMRLIADFPNVVYLVGYDPKYIKTILGEDPEENKSSFMEKIFQLEFDLPASLASDLKNFWQIKLKKYDSNITLELKKDFINLIVDNQIIPNLRDVKRFLNRLSISSSLPEIKNSTYFPQFFLIELIYYSNPNVYYKIKASQTLELAVKIEPVTQKIIEQIKNIASYSEQSITKEEHFGKYFYKRLDKELDINYEDVVSMFKDENSEIHIETLYTKNKKQFIDCILDYTNAKTYNKDSIDKDFMLSYFDKVFHLLEHSYLKEQLQNDFFEKKQNYSCIQLFSGIATVWKLFRYNSNDSTKELENYLKDKFNFNSYSYILANLAQQEKINEMYFDFNSLFIEKIEFCSKRSYDNIIPLLIVMYNYQKFLISSKKKTPLTWLNNETITYELRQNSESISTEIDKINEIDKNINIHSFFGTTEALQKLNDLKTQGIFNMLNFLNCYYPISQENNVTKFVHTFEYDKYNYRINFPKSINKLEIKSKDGNMIFQLNINETKIDSTYYHDIATRNDQVILSKSINEYSLNLYRVNDECLYLIFDINDPQNQEDLSKLRNSINSDPHFEYEILISTEKEEEFILERQLIPRQMQDKINSINKY